MKRNNAAKIALNKKLQLERLLFAEMAAIFRDIAAKSGQPFQFASIYQEDITRVLRYHYARVFDVFGDDYQEANNIRLPRGYAETLNNIVGEVFVYRSDRQGSIITNTNARQLAKIKEIARGQMASMLEINPNISFSRHVSELYGAALLRRVQGIATYETQWAAEFSKAAEVAFLTTGSNVEKKASRKDGNLKRWDAVGDDLMRDWHADADSTLVEIDEPFIVNDEELMYPGDTSLGATASNIINCRCSVSYQLWDVAVLDLDAYPDLTEIANKWKDLGKGADYTDLDTLDNLVSKGIGKAMTQASQSGDIASLDKLEQLLNKHNKLMEAAKATGKFNPKDFIALNNERRAIQKKILGVDSLKVKPPKITPKPIVDDVVDAVTPPAIIPKPAAPNVWKPAPSKLAAAKVINQAQKAALTNSANYALATQKHIDKVQKIIKNARNFAKQSGLHNNLVASEQLIADFGAAVADFKPGITPRKVFSALEYRANKLMEASKLGVSFNASKYVKPVNLPKTPLAAEKLPSKNEIFEKYKTLSDEAHSSIKYKTVKMQAQIDDIWKKRYEEAHNKYGLTNYELPVISSSEAKALARYKSLSSMLNDYQRKQALGYSSTRMDNIEKEIELIHNAIRKSEVLETQTVFRGVADSKVAASMRELKVGDKLANTSTTSTSVKREIAASFSRGMLMEIELPRGTKALYVDPTIRANGHTANHLHEYEVILPKGGFFEVIEKTETRTRFRYIAPTTFADARGGVSQVLSMPRFFVVTQKDADRMTVSQREYYAMLLLGGLVYEAQSFLDEATNA